ncbi:MAG: hypothetical protein ACSLE1_13090 [Sphingobium sp.]
MERFVTRILHRFLVLGLGLTPAGCSKYVREHQSLESGSVRMTVCRDVDLTDYDSYVLSVWLNDRPVLVKHWLGRIFEPARFQLIQITGTLVGLGTEDAPRTVLFWIDTATGAHFGSDEYQLVNRPKDIKKIIEDVGFKMACFSDRKH